MQLSSSLKGEDRSQNFTRATTCITVKKAKLVSEIHIEKLLPGK